MGTPNEFMPSALYGFPQNEVAPYPHQATQPAANFPQFANSGTNNYFNNSGFFTNASNPNSLPSAFHANTNVARTSCFGASNFVPGEPEPSSAMNIYNASATPNIAYWSQEHQLSPFGVLPHEIAADHHVDQPTVYNTQNVHFGTTHTSLNSTGNLTTPNDIFPGLQAPVAKYPEKPTNRQFAVTDGTQSQIDNRLGTSSPLIQQKLSQPAPFVQQSTLEFHGSGHSAPLIQKNITEYQESNRSSPHIQLNVTEYRDDCRSSPLINVPSPVAQSSHCESPFLNRNHVNTVPHANPPLVYGDTQNVVRRNIGENRVTSSYLKLPHTASAVVDSSSANTTEVGYINQSPYVACNSSTNNCAINSHLVEPVEKSVSTFSSCQVEGRSNFPIKITDVEDSNRPNVMSTIPTTTNNLVEYPRCTSAASEGSDSYFHQSSLAVSTETLDNVANGIPAGTKTEGTNFYEGTTQLQRLEQSLPPYQYNAAPSNELVAKPISQPRTTSRNDATACKRSNKIAKYGISLTHTNTCSEPQSIGSNTVNTASNPISVCANSPQKLYLRNKPSSCSTSSAEGVIHASPSQSEISHANSSLDTSRTVQGAISSSSIAPPTRGSTSSSVKAECSSNLIANFTESGAADECSRSTSSEYVLAREEMVGNVRVIKPNIEEEFKFLFDPNLPHYAEIVSDERRILTNTKPTFCRKNVDFLGSYIKFLENNGVNVERLKVGYSNTTESWFTLKTSFRSSTRGEQTSVSALPREESKSMRFEKEDCDFSDDLRYYPLPKTSDERRLTDTSSDEDELDLERRRKAKSDPVIQKPLKSSVKEKNNKSKSSKSSKEGDCNRYTNNLDAMKSNEVNKVKQKKRKHKRDAEKNSKSKRRKMFNEIEEREQSDEERSKYSVKKTEESVGKKVSPRKAKVEVQKKRKKTVKTVDEESANSDPSWSARDDDEEDRFSTRKSSRIVRSAKKLSEPNSSTKKGVKNRIAKSGPREQQSDGETDEDVGSFFVQKSQIDSKKHPLWRLRGDKLQKFEHGKRGGKRVFSSVPKYVNISNSELNKYEKVEVHVVHRSKGLLIVELQDEMEILTDEKVRDNFMSKTSGYESQFAVYVQTLVSQALDSNFLDEITRENDTYFLDNVKVIEDATATYVNDFSSLMKCCSETVDLLMKTWPFVSIKTRNGDSYADGEDVCACCGGKNASKTAVFYGQPYKRETLQGCTTNIPKNIDKTAHLCKGCAKKIQLFNKIWHQKYLLFVECAKCVSKKRTLNKNKVTTDVLNELLADNLWLSKLFYDTRSTWLMVWTVVQKTRKKFCSGEDDDA